MKRDQKLTPKYWVVHSMDCDDVLLDTASKSFHDAWTKFHTNYNIDEADYELYDVSLFKIDFAEGGVI